MNSQLDRRRFLARALGGTLASAAGGALRAFAGSPDASPRAKSPRGLLAGAASVDITPAVLPVISSGGFLEGTADAVYDRLFARGLVLDNGSTRLALAVVDNLMMPRDLIDAAARAASEATGIPKSHMLIAANHIHSGPSVMGALGSRCDEAYAAGLPERIAECIRQADASRVPASAGWASVADHEDTHCRVWIRRPDCIGADPFGEVTIRAMMHPGYQNPEYIGPCGPADPELGLLAVRTREGKPLALLANYAMHYFGTTPISADYFGMFCAEMRDRIAPGQTSPDFVVMMSNGTSGDQHWMDYSRPRTPIDMAQYAKRVATKAEEAFRRIKYRDDPPLAAAETALTLDRRLPSGERLAWAQTVRDGMGGRALPKSQQEVYALEQFYLRDDPKRELLLRAFRVGGLAITAIPCEVYAITGLKLKRRSPFAQTMNIELANGAEGYIPPPELHPFGGYNTWPARTAGLVPEAEPRIVDAMLDLLKQVSGKKLRSMPQSSGPLVRAMRNSNPLAYWPMDTLSGTRCADASGNRMHGQYEPNVAYFLEGPGIEENGHPDGVCRAAHFAGGRMAATIPNLGDTFSVAFWFWNGLPNDARAVTGYLFSRGVDGVQGAPGDHLGIGGTHRDGSTAGRLFLYNGDRLGQTLAGSAVLEPRRWIHLVYVRERSRVSVYLDGQPTPGLSGEIAAGHSSGVPSVWLGGRSDRLFGLEGKMCHAALYRRALEPREIAQLYFAPRQPAGAAIG